MEVEAALADVVLWHDIECGSYAADLPLWREWAAAADGEVLDVGAGTGRVTLDLARRDRAVTALDHDETLLAELRRRFVRDASGFRVEPARRDADVGPPVHGP